MAAPRTLACAVALSLSACVAHDAPPVAASSAQRSLVQLELTYTRVVPQGTAGVALDAAAHFVRYRTTERALDQRAVSTLLGLSQDDDLAVGACRAMDGAEVASGGGSALEISLLDAGSLTVRNAGMVEAVLEPHHYPELLPFVSGVVYGQEGAAAREPSPSARVEIEAEGGEDVGPFVATASVPRAFPDLVVGRIGRDVELGWSPVAAASTVLVELRWSGGWAGARSGSVRCRATDEGRFALSRVDAQLATRLDDALAQGAQVVASVSRSERMTLDAPGAGPGRLLVTLRDTAQLSTP